MCGIAGIFSLTEHFSPHKELIKKMTDAIIHRGPDEEGYFVQPDIALGFRRLSIIDLTSGSQPIHNEDKSVWTIFNGEIYNYQILRSDLKKKGHHFYTESDTEVLVHLYEEYGERMLDYLRGMFAFAIWDDKNKKIFLARDRLGIKPLFYVQTNGAFLFASEMKAILATGLIDKTIDIQALDHYLGLQYVPAPFTIFKDIRKLPPAHCLTVTQKGLNVPKQYWDLHRREPISISFEDCQERLKALLLETIQLHLRSDVPLGFFLSGGVDSSGVVALTSKLNYNNLKTFTICHHDSKYDESSYAEAVSKQYGTEHHTLHIGPSDLLSLVPSIVEQYDEPFADSSALPTYIVSQLARNHVKVVLSGDGGDETMAGYKRYAMEFSFDRLAKLFGLTYFSPPFIKTFLKQHMNFSHSPINKLNKIFINLLSTVPERHFFLFSYFRFYKRMLYGPALIDSATLSDITLFEQYLSEVKKKDLVSKLLYLDLKTYLPNDILYKVDIASMANSIEVRPPLLDHLLVEFLYQIPSSYKLRKGEGKYIFKCLLEPSLSSDILYRKKQGFEIPISTWFRKDLSTYIQDLLFSSPFLKSPFFNEKTIQKMVRRHQEGKEDFGPHLWMLMVLALWYEKWMKS